MGDDTSAAVVRALIGYANTAADINGALTNEARNLQSALELFAKTCTEPALKDFLLIQPPISFVGPIASAPIGPGLAGELREYVRHTSPKDEWVRRVGEAFAKADDKRESDAESVKESGSFLPEGSAFLQAQEASVISLAAARGSEIKTGPANRMARPSSAQAVYRAEKGTGFKVVVKDPKIRKATGIRRQDTKFKKGFRDGVWRSPTMRHQIKTLTKSAAADAALPKSNISPKVTGLARGLWVAQIGLSGAENWTRYQGDETDVRVAKTTAATTFDSAVSIGINVGMTAAGTAGGAAIGGAIGGPIGAAIGARVGGIVGSFIGQKITDGLMGSDWYKEARDGIAGFVGGLFD